MKQWVTGAGTGLLFFIAVLCNCGIMSVATDTGGSTSEVVGKVLYRNGEPVQNASVKLRRTDYFSDTIPGTARASFTGADTMTDGAGEFTVNVPDTGNYCIEVNDQKASAVLLRYSLSQKAGRVSLPDDTLEPTGTVQGHIALSPNILSKVYVQVFGLEKIAVVDPATGMFRMSDLPKGDFTLRFVTASSMQTPTTVDPVAVASGQVTTIDTVKLTGFGIWKYSKRLYFNTTSTGAGISGNILNFPVLFRLTNSNFDFTQASPAGADIRFAKQDNTPLACEIERWDASQGSAEIWVKVDTVYGNDSAHYVTMYWGNSNATSVSNGATVFDTSNGFQGVWHMGQSQAPTLDATINHYNGTPSDTSPIAVPGAIGICQQFNGVSNYIQMAGTASGKLNFPEHGRYAISAWVYTDTLDTAYQRIVCKNNFQYKLQIDYFKTWSFAEYENAIGYELTNSPAISKAWVYLVGVRSGSSQYLYVNGVCTDSTIVAQAYSALRDTTSDVTIGRSAKTPPGDPCFFRGKIDEVRIENKAMSADWVKLEYMNQKADDALVKFK
jgi:hypothetical protein